MNKKRIKSICIYFVFFGFIYLGLFFVLSPWLKPLLIVQNTQHFLLSEFTEQEIASNVNRLGNIVDLDEPNDAIIDPDFQTVVRNISNANRQNVIGAIVIADIELYLPILAGTTNEHLMVGAATFGNYQVMGEGNFVLAGHHLNGSDALFGSILDVQVGNLIQVTDMRYVYTYEVVETGVVHENEVSILEPSMIPTITLITCDVPNVSTLNRFIVRGYLVDISLIDDGDYTLFELFDVAESGFVGRYPYSFSLFGIALLSLIFVLGLMLWDRSMKYKQS